MRMQSKSEKYVCVKTGENYELFVVNVHSIFVVDCQFATASGNYCKLHASRIFFDFLNTAVHHHTVIALLNIAIKDILGVTICSSDFQFNKHFSKCID